MGMKKSTSGKCHKVVHKPIPEGQIERNTHTENILSCMH